MRFYYLNGTSFPDGPVETVPLSLEPERASHEEAGPAPRAGEVGAVPAAVRVLEAGCAVAVVGAFAELEIDHETLDL